MTTFEHDLRPSTFDLRVWRLRVGFTRKSPFLVFEFNTAVPRATFDLFKRGRMRSKVDTRRSRALESVA